MKFNFKTIALVLLVGTLSLMYSGCGGNLDADVVTATKTFSWVATGDDGIVGQASLYTMKYSKDSDSLVNNWADLPTVPGFPTPSLPLTEESFGVTMEFDVGVEYFFAMKVADEIQPKVYPNGDLNANHWVISGADTVAVESAQISGGRNVSLLSNIVGVYFLDLDAPSPIFNLTVD